MSAGDRRPATTVVPVAVVRRLEAEAMAELPEGTLMQRAAAAIAVQAGGMLREVRGRVTGSRVVLPRTARDGHARPERGPGVPTGTPAVTAPPKERPDGAG